MNNQKFSKESSHEFDDIFSRKIQIENIYNMIKNNDNGFVASIDSQFGMGKTTFLKMFKSHIDINSENKIISIYYDAWENDFFDDPFLSLLSCFDKELKSKDNATFSDMITAFANIGSKGISFITSGIVDISEIKDELNSTPIRTAISNYQDLMDLRSEIYSLFELLTKNKKKIEYKVVFFIDELDRCKPTFALKLLETIKHFFNLPNYYFIIAVHKEQLASTIKLKYGSHIDTSGYLRRFIDFDIILNPISIEKYINLKSGSFTSENTMYGDLFQMLIIASENQKLSLRDIDKILLLLNLILPKDWLNQRLKSCTSASPYELFFEMHLLAVLLVLKVSSPELYKGFIEMNLDGTEQNEIVKISTSELIKKKFREENPNNRFKGETCFLPKFGDAFHSFYNVYKNKDNTSASNLYSFNEYLMNISRLLKINGTNLDVINRIQISDSIKY